MRLKRYSVTVMDNWTPTRFFWTEAGARKWFNGFMAAAHLFRWRGSWGGFWEKIAQSKAQPE
jgi:hypothetical protein